MDDYIFSCNIDQCNFYGEDVKGATKCEEDLPSFKSSPGAKPASQRLQNEVYIIPVREKQASN
jgi:hypothetical protein